MRKAWVIRANINGTNYAKQFYEKSTIGIGWGRCAAFKEKSKKEIKDLLAGAPYNLSSLELGNAYASVNNFVNEMQKSDLVLVPNDEDIYIVEVDGEYEGTRGYPFDDKDDIHNIRTVKPIRVVNRKNLSMGLRKALRVQRTVADISKFVDEIEALAHGREYVPKAIDNKQSVNLSYQLRPDYEIRFSVPIDMTDDEANRLSDYFKTIYFQKSDEA